MPFVASAVGPVSVAELLGVFTSGVVAVLLAGVLAVAFLKFVYWVFD